jgi:hypothetical protein
MRPAVARIWFTCLAALLARVPQAPEAAAQSAGADTVVELPPMIVADRLKTRPWRYLEIPGYEVLSRASDSHTRDVVETHHRLEHLLSLVLPPDLQVRSDVPSPLLLSNEVETPTLARNLVQNFGSTPAPRIRYLPNLALNDSDIRAVFAMINPAQFNPDRLTFTRERVAYAIERRVPALPRWFAVGFLELWDDMRFTADQIEIGPLTWISDEERKNLRADPDYPRVFLPWHELLAWRRGRVPDEASPEHALWRSQAALLVRWILSGDRARREAWWKFVARSSTEPVTDRLLRECLDLDYAGLRDCLSDYLPSAITTPVRLRADKMPRAPRMRLRDATPAEVARLKGEWERLVVRSVKLRHPEFVDRYREQAERTFAEADRQNASDPRLFAVRGLYYCDIQNDDAALPLLEASARAKVTRPRIYVELARIHYLAARRNRDIQQTPLDTADVNRALAPLAMAHEQQPLLPDVFLLSAEVWAQSNARLSTRNLGLLEEGLREFPDHPLLRLNIAVVYINQQQTQKARAVIEEGLALRPPPLFRDRLLGLRSHLPAEPASSSGAAK